MKEKAFNFFLLRMSRLASCVSSGFSDRRGEVVCSLRHAVLVSCTIIYPGRTVRQNTVLPAVILYCTGYLSFRGGHTLYSHHTQHHQLPEASGSTVDEVVMSLARTRVGALLRAAVVEPDANHARCSQKAARLDEHGSSTR